jgi:hypothetical protein
VKNLLIICCQPREKTAEPAGPQLPAETFDLVDLTDRAAALRVMTDALWPADGRCSKTPAAARLPNERGPTEELANRPRTQIRTSLTQRGAVLAYARTLPRPPGESDLPDVNA